VKVWGECAETRISWHRYSYSDEVAILLWPPGLCEDVRRAAAHTGQRPAGGMLPCKQATAASVEGMSKREDAASGPTSEHVAVQRDRHGVHRVEADGELWGSP
jgi:hypothetical protein